MALIAVVGKGRNCPAEVEEVAFSVGAAVARSGHVTVTGGYAGVMVAAAHGAAARGGRVLALLPEGRTVPDDFPPDAIVVPTGLSIPVRNVVVGACCAAMLALHGSHGAMQELAVAIDREVPVAAVATDTWSAFGVRRIEPEEVGSWLHLIA